MSIPFCALGKKHFRQSLYSICKGPEVNVNMAFLRNKENVREGESLQVRVKVEHL